MFWCASSAFCELWPYCDHNLLGTSKVTIHLHTLSKSIYIALSKSICIYIVKITVTPWSDFCLQPVPPCLTIMRWTLRNINCCQTKRKQDYLRLCVFLFFLCNTFSLLFEIHGQILFEASDRLHFFLFCKSTSWEPPLFFCHELLRVVVCWMKKERRRSISLVWCHWTGPTIRLAACVSALQGTVVSAHCVVTTLVLLWSRHSVCGR